MASQSGLQCGQSRDDTGFEVQMLQGISENVCAKKHSSPVTTDKNSNVPTPNNMVSLYGTTDVMCDGISGQNKDDLAVVKQVLADICDRIGSIDCSDVNSNNQLCNNQNVFSKQIPPEKKNGEHNVPNENHVPNDHNVSHNQEASNKLSILNMQNFPNKQSISNEQNVSNEQLQSQGQPSNEPNFETCLTSTHPDKILHDLSTVQEDIKVLGITTGTPKLPNGNAEHHQLLTNGKEKEATSTDESDSSDESSPNDDSSSSDESSSGDENSSQNSHSADSESEDDEANLSGTKITKWKKHGGLKTKDELTFADLPDVEPLDFCLEESVELTPLGEVESILSDNAFVIIKSFENVPAVDADSILFLEDRSGFGRVFDIFGKVKYPHYCVRFNNTDEIKSTNIEIGQTVHFAPDTKDLTNFVFVSQLNSLKGSDASWENDQEPPPEFLEYSDDETEAQQKSERKWTYQLKRRHEAQTQGEGPIAAKSRKQRPFKSRKKTAWTNQSYGPQHNGHSQGGGFVPPQHERRGQVAPPPNNQKPPVRIPAQSRLPNPPQTNPNGPHSGPFSPPFMRPPVRHFAMPLGPPGHPRPPFQNLAHSSQPDDCLPHNARGSQPWITENNVPPNRPPGIQQVWSVGRPSSIIPRLPPRWPPKIKKESTKNARPQCLGHQPWMSRGNTLPNEPPMNQHRWPAGQPNAPPSPDVKPDIPDAVRKYLDM